ncbi:MAG: RNA-binding protein [Dehalococcoidia bacterium]
MNIFVGNLSYEVTDDQLHAAFAPYGDVASATVIMDRYSGRSRGFGFVEMPNNSEGQAAIDALNGADLGGRRLTVNEARPRGAGGGGDRGGFGGGDRGDRGGYGGGRGGDRGDRGDRGPRW